MTEAEHKERLRKIETETEKIKQQIMQLEFQHKKDAVEIRKIIKHVAKLVGITYDELDKLDFKLQETGRHLSKPRERSTFS